MSRRLRPLLATVIFALVAIPAVQRGGPSASFAWGAPILALSSTWLCDHITDRDPSPGARIALMSLCWLAPAAGARLWSDRIALLDATWLDTAFPVSGLLSLAQTATLGPAWLLLGAAITTICLGGRRALSAGGAAVGGLAALGLAPPLLEAIDRALFVGDTQRGVNLSLALPPLALLPFIGAGLGLLIGRWRGGAGPSRREALLLLSLCAGQAWCAASPLGPLLRTMDLDLPDTGTPLSLTAPGTGVSADLLDPHRGPLAEQLVALGHPASPRKEVAQCVPKAHARWAHVARATVALAWDESAPFASLEPVLELLLTHRVRRVALVGRAPSIWGPLSPALRWPAVRLNIDLPPPGAVAVALPGPAPERAAPVCMIQPTPEVKVGALYASARALSSASGGPCGAFALPPLAQRVLADPLGDISCPD